MREKEKKESEGGKTRERKSGEVETVLEALGEDSTGGQCLGNLIGR